MLLIVILEAIIHENRSTFWLRWCSPFISFTYEWVSGWVLDGLNLMFFHHHAHSITVLEKTKRKKIQTTTLLPPLRNAIHSFIHSIYISAIVLQKYEYFVYNFWCHVSYWWGYDENGKVENEEEKLCLGLGDREKRELASKQASKQAREAWKMKIFPINTKLNEHDFWDIDGFQFFFFFVFHLLCKKKNEKNVYFDIFMLRDQLRWGKFFFPLSVSPSMLSRMNGWWYGDEGTKVVFNRSLLLMRNGLYVCIPNPSLSINSQ